MDLLDSLIAVIAIFLFHVAVIVLCTLDKKTSRIATVLQLQLDGLFSIFTWASISNRINMNTVAVFKIHVTKQIVTFTLS